MSIYTITIFSENTPGVLHRISGLFLKQKVNVESLTVSEIEQRGISRFTIVVKANQPLIQKIVKQLYRIIEVIKVFESTDDELVHKEVAFIKVTTKNPSQRTEVEDLAYLFNARIAHVGTSYLLLEKTGSEEEINSLHALVKPFGIKEFVRSGRIAVLKDEQKMEGTLTEISKEPSYVASSIDVSSIKKIQLMTIQEKGAISLAQGIPSFDTADHIKKAAKKAMDNHLTDRYTPGYGIPELRQALAKKVTQDNGIKATEDNIIVTHGAIEGLMAVFLTICNAEDELVVLSPDYASHVTQIQIARHGGKPLYVPLIENDEGWKLDPLKLESTITPKTKAIILTNPCNPTGKVYTKEELKEIARIALKHNVFIISDETYEYFTFDERKHISIGSFPEVQDRVISIMSTSKSYCMTGWRIGYIVANESLIKHVFKIHDSLVTCPTAISQYAALEAITGPQNVVQEYKEAFEKRRKIVMDAIAKSKNLTLVSPEGAYYAFIKVNKPVDDYDLAVRMVHEAKVGVIPGSAFGLGGENHIRVSFGGEEKLLKEGLERLVAYVKSL
jgi:aminotransferase